jgi:hypothetical protein
MIVMQDGLVRVHLAIHHLVRHSRVGVMIPSHGVILLSPVLLLRVVDSVVNRVSNNADLSLLCNHTYTVRRLDNLL